MPEDQPPKSFADIARSTRPSLLRDVWKLLCETKKWWLLPIIVVLLLISVLLLASGSALAPFIYTLF